MYEFIIVERIGWFLMIKRQKELMIDTNSLWVTDHQRS